MVSFITLFLGLIVGPQPIKVLVSEGVATVEIVIDGTTVAELDGRPWTFTWDFGSDLMPHDLVAVALDVDGAEIGRVRQRLNLPRRTVEASVVVRGDPEGQNRTAHVNWESRSGAQPVALRAEFDGGPVTAESPTSIALPAHDPQELHFLRIDVDFDDGRTSSAEVTFGGSYLDTVSSEVMAVPVVLDGRKKLPDVGKLTGWFGSESGETRVLAAEKGEAEIVIVRSRSSVGDLRWIQKQELNKALPGAFWRRSSLFASQEWSLRLIWPISRSRLGNRTPFDLFPYSTPGPTDSGSLVQWITEADPPDQLIGHQRLADAVAVAGVAAATNSGRRVVVLVLGQEEPDESTLEPAAVRGYLRALRVPLYVWSTRPQSAAVRGWGRVTDISKAEGLKRAVNEAFESLSSQRIVWVAGDYLPQQVRLTDNAKGVHLAD